MYSKIIAVDFDGTLCENKWPEIGLPDLDMIDYLVKRKKDGARLILWTCRSGDKLEEAVLWAQMLGLEFDAVNENLPEIIQSFGGNTRKVFAHEYIDDRNHTFNRLKKTDESSEVMFAIKNIKTGKFVFGTDYRYSPPHQRTSNTQMFTYDSLASAKVGFISRKCSKRYYRIVVLKPVEVDRIIDFNSEQGYDVVPEDWENTNSKGEKDYE